MPFVIRMYKLETGSVPSNDHLGQWIEDYILYTHTYIYTVNLGYNMGFINNIDHYDHNPLKCHQINRKVQVICYIFETM